MSSLGIGGQVDSFFDREKLMGEDELAVVRDEIAARAESLPDELRETVRTMIFEGWNGSCETPMEPGLSRSSGAVDEDNWRRSHLLGYATMVLDHEKV